MAVALLEGRIGLQQFSEPYLSGERIIATANIVDYMRNESLSREVQHFPGIAGFAFGDMNH